MSENTVVPSNEVEKEVIDANTSPGQLQDVTMDHSYALGYRSPCLSIPYAGGSTSPGQGRSVREFEEQMAALRKENFNLKLRIYFLEEKVNGYSSSNPDGHESLVKQNVDLKVDVEVLRKELQEKQAIICEAAKALELMEDQRKAIEEKSQSTIDELNQKIQLLEMEIRDFDKLHTGQQHSLEQLMGHSDLVGDVNIQQKVRELEGLIKQFEQKTDELTAKNKEFEESIAEKDNSIKEFHIKIKQLMFQNAELQEQLDCNVKESSVTIEYPKIKEELLEHKAQLADKICLLDEIETKLNNKTVAHENACQAIKKLLTNIAELKAEIEKLKKSSSTQSISELKQLSFDSETTALCKTFNEMETGDGILDRDQLIKLVEDKDLEINKLKLEVKKKTANLQNLVNKELWEKNREIERLIKLLGKSTNNPSATLPCSPVHDVDQLQQSFSESDYSQAIERNKYLQKKVDTLIQRLCSVSERKVEPNIEQLKIELQEAREETDKANHWRKECADVCSILTARLEELAGFLDSLLKHKDVLCVLAADRRRAIRKAVDKSLDLSRSLNMSFSVSGLSLGDQSLVHLSNISSLLDHSVENKENKTFNSHEESTPSQTQVIENLKAEIKTLKRELDKRRSILDGSKKDRRSLPLKVENHSESETWSEPDRNVSLARIGLEERIVHKGAKGIKDIISNSSPDSTSEDDIKSKSKTVDKISQLELIISQRDNEILKAQCDLVESDNRLKRENIRFIEQNRELEEYKRVNGRLELEIATYKCVQQQGVFNEQEYLKRQLEEKTRLNERLADDRDKLNVEVRVAELKMATLKADLEELQTKHERNIEVILDREEEKLMSIEKNVTEKYENKLKEQELKHQEYLARDWVSRSIYENTRKEFEDAQKKLSEAQITIDLLQENDSELNAQLIENEKSMRSLKKSLDDAALQSSKVVLERTKALNDKLALETKIQELITKLDSVEREKSDLCTQLSQIESSNLLLHNKFLTKKSSGSDVSQSGYTSEEVPMGPKIKTQRIQRLNNSSPDLGIESDAGRTSSVEIAQTQAQLLRTVELSTSVENVEVGNDEHQKLAGDEVNTAKLDGSNNNPSTIVKHDCAKVDQENAELKRKLIRTKRAFEDTWTKLRIANQRKEQIERDIRQQIVKTQNVLKNVRTNMESELEQQHKKESS